jgi:uncharacterized protein (TIRG00374 family)
LKRAWPVLRPLLGVTVAAWLVYALLHAPGVDVVATLQKSDKSLLLAAMAVYSIGFPIMVVRWQALLRVQGFHLPPLTMLRLVLVGNFFNLVVPGAVGGDVAKAACLAAHTPEGRRVEGLLTVFVDRIVGGIGLLVLTSFSIAASWRFLRAADPRLGALALSIGGVGVAAVLGVWAVLWRERWAHLAVARWARRFIERVLPGRVVDMARRVVHALDLYRSTPGTVLFTVALSVAGHAVATFVVILLARAAGENGAGIDKYFLAVQVANAVGMIPLTPGGIGGRDVVMFLLLSKAGASASQAAVVPVLYSATATLWALAGGGVYLGTRDPAGDGGPVRASADP